MTVHKSSPCKLLLQGAMLIVSMFAGTTYLAAQSSVPSDRGFTAYAEARASDSASGQFAAIDTDLGVDFTRHLGMDIGIPVYFIRPTVATQAHEWDNRLGDPYWDMRFAADSRTVNYATVFTVSVPTQQTGAFSTGHLSFDWFNHFDYPIYRFRPFINAGVANGILNTHQLSQPFRLTQVLKTSGFLGIVEGGTDFRVWHKIKVGSSFYAIEPAGTQKIAGQPLPNTTLTPLAILANHDRGVSTWVRFFSSDYIYSQVGYNHSFKLDEDAATVTLGFDFTPLFRKRTH